MNFLFKIIKNKFFKEKQSQPKIIGAKFYFRPNKLSFTQIKKWIAECNHFITPLAFDWEVPFDIEKFDNWTMETFAKNTINIEGENIGTGRFRDTEHFWLKDFHNYHSTSMGNFVQLYIRFKFNAYKVGLLESFLLEKGFIAGFVFDEKYINDQSQYYFWNGEEGRKYAKKKYYKGRRLYRDKHNQLRIDISQNYGRKTGNENFIYHGASIMWFGEEFFKNFEKEKLLSFTQAVQIREIEDDLVLVHLYEGIFDGDLRENQERQKSFRKLLKIDNNSIA